MKNEVKIASSIRTIIKLILSMEHRIALANYLDSIKLLFHSRDIGKNVYLDKSVHVLGWNSIRIGHSTAICEATWLNVNQRTDGHKHIVIGNNCYIGKRNFFSAGWLIEISDYCMTGVGCKLIGSDHIFEEPFKPYITTNTTNDKTIKLGVNARLGAGVMVVGNVSIGHGSIIGAGSLVNKNIPPFSIAVGSPCKVIKRYDFLLNKWVKVEDYANTEKVMPSEHRYLEMLIKDYPKIIMPIKACGKSQGDLF